ncbi:LysR family transcriptional regulator [Agromyces archimandritae]|uniref:LysR family transcriptional regulator n=1 Tax=Agromyces archimandritae TaxID=2781962 RepID=A0A975FK49_9MICO|nr:LysR family transcriptional regulator [Agromyces archimandritae]QTX03341.1 LysR family transcriptional regulator [Agromyces archimandritae]
MSEFSLRQLEYFVAVVDEESVTDAARRLRVSPGAVSFAMKQLEDSLQVQLTLRVPGKGVGVTPAGRWAYAHARAVLERADDIRSVALAVRGELAGPLRVGCFTTLSPWLFPRIAAHFARAYPGIDLQLHEGVSSELQALLRAGELDVALLYRNHLGPGVVGEPVIPVRLQLALAPEHPLAELDEVPLAALEAEPAILLGVQPAIGHVEEILRAAGMHPNVRWRSTNVETIRSMVARGLGYTIIMGRPYGDRTYDGLPIVYRRIADEMPDNAVVVAVAQGTRPTAKVSALTEFCQREFRGEGRVDAGTGAL